jgi:hypothetical protein
MLRNIVDVLVLQSLPFSFIISCSSPATGKKFSALASNRYTLSFEKGRRKTDKIKIENEIEKRA